MRKAKLYLSRCIDLAAIGCGAAALLGLHVFSPWFFPALVIAYAVSELAISFHPNYIKI